MRNHILKRVVFIWIILLVLVALIGDVSVAQTDGGRTAADFLLIGTGARAAGMGDAYTAVAAGAEAAYWNPAGMAGMEEHEVVLGHFSLLQDVSLEHGAFAYAANEKTTVAVAVTYLNYGTIDGFDVSGQATQDLSAYDFAAGLSLGYELTDELALGLTGKYINQNLDDITGSGVAADIGVRYIYRTVTLAATVNNIGTGVSYDETTEKLPLTGRFGVAVPLFENALITALELEKRRYMAPEIRHGVEVNLHQQYFLRTGYNLSLDSQNESRATTLSLGAGWRSGDFAIDYAYTLEDKYSSEDIHRFSMSFNF